MAARRTIGVGECFAFYNERPLHQALGYRAPMAVWRQGAAPTGGPESAADRTLGGLIKDNQQTAFLLNRRPKRFRCPGPLQSKAKEY